MPKSQKNKKGITALRNAELLRIKQRHHGLLRPTDVVAFARNSNTALHSYFVWDNTQAAKQYRLWQARQLIAVVVTIVTPEIPQHRVYVSMESDRKRGKAGQSKGGYRATADVQSQADLRAQLLRQMKTELRVFVMGFKRRYGAIAELIPVFAAIDNVLSNV